MRHLNKQQKNRLELKKAKYQETYSESPEISTYAGLVIACYGKNIDIEDKAGCVHRSYLRQSLENIAVGDIILWQYDKQKNVIIIAVQPRYSSLYRFNKFEGEKLIAANIDQMLIFIASEPLRSLNVLDRYLLISGLYNIPACIVFNKIDLLNSSDKLIYQKKMSIYENMGYPIIYLSILTQEGSDTLLSICQKKTSIVLGVSGVGKSSLISSLTKNPTINIAPLSEKNNEGTHTTTIARLYHLPEQEGKIIDCPGIRELSFGDLTQSQIEKGFKDIALFSSDCPFRDCTHSHEPSCAVLKALDEKKIHKDRYNSFKNLKK